MGKLSFPYERGFSEQYRSLVPPRLAMRDVFQLEASLLRRDFWKRI
jgi:hypothetical protein